MLQGENQHTQDGRCVIAIEKQDAAGPQQSGRWQTVNCRPSSIFYKHLLTMQPRPSAFPQAKCPTAHSVAPPPSHSLLALSLLLGSTTTAWANDALDLRGSHQLSPSGYSGAINTPTGDVLPWGAAGIALSNSNPETKRTVHSGGFGSVNAGVGVLPGLELVGRLAFEGDLQCNIYARGHCDAKQRDLSLSGKYQLPLELPLNTRMALGFTDYGGAATNYRQVYGVATSTVGPLDLSLGYGRPKSNNALLDGAFGSVSLRITDRLGGTLEHDSRELRTGMHYVQPLSRNTSLQLGLSRKLTDATGQQRWQATAALNILLGRPEEVLAPSRRVEPVPLALALPSPAPAVPAERPDAPIAPGPLPSQVPAQGGAMVVSTLPSGTERSADALAKALAQKGFAHIRVRHWPQEGEVPGLWQVQAEPRRWRQNQLDAVAVVLAQWFKQVDRPSGAPSNEALQLTLTYQRVPTLEARTTAACLEGWLTGMDTCQAGQSAAIALNRATALTMASAHTQRSGAPKDEANLDGGPAWAPQVEIGPSLRTTVGTELGLFDYSLAAEVGGEVNLGKGLFWQGTYQIPVARSSDYDAGGALGSSRHAKARVDTAMVSYWRQLPMAVSAQVSGGYLNTRYLGGQLDALWMNEDGRWRVSGTVGHYKHETLNLSTNPALVEGRYTVVPGLWSVEATAGRFLGGDQGYRLGTRHWFGETQVQLFYRSSKGDPINNLGQRVNALGFTISLPLGPKEALAMGPSTVRGTDRWEWGLQTKVGGKDNALPIGYGELPRLRHGLMTDVSDHDRNGGRDLQARLKALRTNVQEQLAQ